MKYIVGDRAEGLYLMEYRVYHTNVLHYGKIIGREYASAFTLDKARELAEQYGMKVYKETYSFEEVTEWNG